MATFPSSFINLITTVFNTTIDFIPVEQVHLIEIITGFNTMKRNEIFNFIYSFNPLVR